MIAYCWATGLIEFGRIMPEGAIEVARGGAKKLREVVGVCARHGKGKGAGQLLVPGVPEASSQQAKGDALLAWLKWCAKGARGIHFNVPTEHVGVDLESDAWRKCRDCGCTAISACLGGCFWVDIDLCSACARA